MYVRPTSTRLLRGMLIPAIRAISRSPLALLVSGVLADHEDRAVAADDLALLAHRLDRRSYLHDPFRLAETSDAGSGRRTRLPLPVADVHPPTCVGAQTKYDSRGLPAARTPENAVATARFQLSRSPTTDPVRDISMTTRASLPGGLTTAIVPRWASTARAARMSAPRPEESTSVVGPRSRITSRQPSSSASSTARSSLGAVPM